VDVPSPFPQIGSSTSCATPVFLTRTINVPESFIIGDLDVGFLANHAWRTDIHFDLISPAGTTVALLNGPFGANLDNYNVRFDDESATQVDTGFHASSDSLVGAPNVVQPEGGTLSSFDGENAQGLWTMRYCDVFPGADNGNLRRTELFFTEATRLSAAKTTSVWDPSGAGLYAVPGNDVIYTITISNAGAGATDANTVELIDAVPPEVEFYNGDIDDGGPETNPVSFTQTGTPGLTFTYATDVRFSDAATKPANFAACSLTTALTAGYNSHVTFICFNPKGALAAGSPDPEFSVSFRARIE
jgi:uncharacterized repeat protein (TIGR01451 family)